jgi:hypothetical protein
VDEYCENMKNVTVSVDPDSYRRARLVAAERGVSVSALVRDYLSSLGSEESHADRLRREEAALRARIGDFSAADRLSRDDVHARDA